MKDAVFGVILVVIAYIAGIFSAVYGLVNIGPITAVKAHEVSVTAVPQQRPMYRAGEVVQLDGYTVRMDSVRYEGATLVADFTMDNSNGPTDTAVSSAVEFTAKDREGYPLFQTYCNRPTFAGRVLSGDKLRGSICWHSAIPGNGIKIYYMPTFTNQETIVWLTE